MDKLNKKFNLLMCIVAWITNFNKYKLILICNREESYSRPTTTVYPWPDKKIIASQDLLHNGTQLAIDLNGRISVLTNLITETNIPTQGANTQSRGSLTVNYHSSPNSRLGEYINTITDNNYKPYNLLLGELRNGEYIMSYSKYKGEKNTILDSSKAYVLENKGLDDHVDRNLIMKSLFTNIIECPLAKSDENKDDLIEYLFQVLNNENIYRYDADNNYGTRTQTVILIIKMIK